MDTKVLDKFFDRFSYKFKNGYPNLEDKEDLLLLESIFKELNIPISLNEEAQFAKFGYRIGEFGTPSETLESRNWNFSSKIGYLGTGYYFYGDHDLAKQDRKFLNRNQKIFRFPLNQYNLFQPKSPERFYNVIKEVTRGLGIYASDNTELEDEKEVFDEIVSELQQVGISLSNDKIMSILKGFIEDVKSKNDGPMLSNRLLTALGYEGIDNTNTSLDNYGVGSVIFSK